ncbi:MAG: hypothetical protein Q8930_20565 [Bacillota bacterium]|nr:hypothetical protein [Bacillota bacterium]
MELLYIIDPTKTEFSNTVDKIAGRPEYKNLASSIADFVANIRQRIEEELMKLLAGTVSKAANAFSISSGASTVILILSLLIILALIVFIVIRIGKSFERRRKVTEILGEKIDEDTTPVTLKKKAALSLAEGDIRGAIRYDFIALLLMMHEKNILYLDEAKTNEEMYYFLKRREFKLLANFRYCIDTFNLVWYGHKAEDREIYEKWSYNLNELWNGVTVNESKNK